MKVYTEVAIYRWYHAWTFNFSCRTFTFDANVAIH